MVRQPPKTSPSNGANILLTGFDAFDGARVNASWLAVAQLNGKKIAGHRVVAAQLPTVFSDAPQLLTELIRRHSPALVVAVGQAGGRQAISLERIAINIDDARIPDNAGHQPADTPVVTGGPAAYFSSLPLKAMLQSLQHAGIAAELSHSAGTFVCNHVFYALMHELAARPPSSRPRAGFIHLPYLPEQGMPCLSLNDMVRGLELAVTCALAAPHDTAQHD